MKLVKPGDNKPRNLKRDYKDLVMEAWDRLYGPEDRAERRKKLWNKEAVNRKARSRL